MSSRGARGRWSGSGLARLGRRVNILGVLIRLIAEREAYPEVDCHGLSLRRSMLWLGMEVVALWDRLSAPPV